MMRYGHSSCGYLELLRFQHLSGSSVVVKMYYHFNATHIHSYLTLLQNMQQRTSALGEAFSCSLLHDDWQMLENSL